MIFVTIGTQLPFDRLIKTIDELAPQIDEEIIAQVHQCGFTPKNIKTISFLAPDKFNELFDKARVIVAHAGMGTILSALQKNKPIIIFPRIAAMGEHRNEHQLATAKKFKEAGFVYVVNEGEGLKKLLQCTDLEPLHHIGTNASRMLVASLKEYIG